MVVYTYIGRGLAVVSSVVRVSLFLPPVRQTEPFCYTSKGPLAPLLQQNSGPWDVGPRYKKAPFEQSTPPARQTIQK